MEFLFPVKSFKSIDIQATLHVFQENIHGICVSRRGKIRKKDITYLDR